MTKQEFFRNNSLAGSLAILALDEGGDRLNELYQALLDYRNMPIKDFLSEFDEEMSEKEFLSYVNCSLNDVAEQIKQVRKFICLRMLVL
ncbi:MULTISPECIES: hypothetical protein [Pasteurellaceae]|uniref:hypothetical protein n=1 Tax=Pasteurellaceae TaxID=712 RepID=UPI0005099201|nr:hypothetical protein AUSP0112_00012 [uncultured phage]